jgi:DtxR family transcriptional regulator, Mn-dependent transcriptional regulator
VRITISKEDYLKAIAEATDEGKPVIAASLARWLGVSAPAVMMAVRRLTRDGLAEVNASGHITLSAAGAGIAGRVRARHNLIERMLTEMFGMEWYKVHEEAERLEHAVSEEFERRLDAVLGGGKACPHGNVPGRESPEDRREMGWLPLDEAEPGARFRVASVYERDRELLEALDRMGVRPGIPVVVEALNDDGTLTLKAAGAPLRMEIPVAEKIWVTRGL